MLQEKIWPATSMAPATVVAAAASIQVGHPAPIHPSTNILRRLPAHAISAQWMDLAHQSSPRSPGPHALSISSLQSTVSLVHANPSSVHPPRSSISLLPRFLPPNPSSPSTASPSFLIVRRRRPALVPGAFAEPRRGLQVCRSARVDGGLPVALRRSPALAGRGSLPRSWLEPELGELANSELLSRIDYVASRFALGDS
jgi:hypothetical protein